MWCNEPEAHSSAGSGVLLSPAQQTTFHLSPWSVFWGTPVPGCCSSASPHSPAELDSSPSSSFPLCGSPLAGTEDQRSAWRSLPPSLLLSSLYMRHSHVSSYSCHYLFSLNPRILQPPLPPAPSEQRSQQAWGTEFFHQSVFVCQLTERHKCTYNR